MNPVPPRVLEFYQRAKSYAGNAIEAGVKWADFREAITLAVVHAAMEKAKGNRSKAARMLGMHRNQIARYLPTKRDAHNLLRNKTDESNA